MRVSLLGVSFIPGELKKPTLVKLILNEFRCKVGIILTRSLDGFEERGCQNRGLYLFSQNTLLGKIGSSEAPADTPAIRQENT